MSIWEDSRFLCFLKEKGNACTDTKRFYAGFHRCNLGTKQFTSAPWVLQAERRLSFGEVSPKQGCAGTGYLITIFLWSVLALRVCGGFLGFLQGTCPDRHPYGAIFSIALQISVIKILSAATFILEYPQTLCKTAQEISVAIYHLVN